MKKEFSLAPFLISLLLIILAALCVYFGWQVNRQEARLNRLQATVTDNSNKVNAVVSFINASLSAGQKNQ